MYGAARAAGASAIVARNCKDFTRSTLPVSTPELLLAALHADLGLRRLSIKGMERDVLKTEDATVAAAIGCIGLFSLLILSAHP